MTAILYVLGAADKPCHLGELAALVQECRDRPKRLDSCVRRYAELPTALFRLSIMLLGMGVVAMAAGCSSLDSFGGSRQAAKEWAEKRGFVDAAVKAGTFDLTAFIRHPEMPVGTLTIYIEGDGAAWPTPYHPPRDPTPLKPVALALAAADTAPAVAYLGRPCQYLATESLVQCPRSYWVEKRFAAEVIEAADDAVAQLKALSGASHIRLVGYSGGGVIAALLAARRSDVDALVTVAAPLALAKWIAWHGASAMTGSLDPIDFDSHLPDGLHFVGSNDKTVPAAILNQYVGARGGKVVVIAGFDHECCWSRDWSMLLQYTLAKEAK